MNAFDHNCIGLSSPVRGGIIVGPTLLVASPVVGAISRRCRSDGACESTTNSFYKDAAPMALERIDKQKRLFRFHGFFCEVASIKWLDW